MCVDDVVGGDGREAGLGQEGEGGVGGRASADGCEQRALSCSAPAHDHEAEDDDWYEGMAGDENMSVQRADGGSGLTGGIKKKRPPRKRAKGEKSRQQRQDAARPGWLAAGPARHEDPALPSGEREHGPNCARAFRPRAPLSRRLCSPLSLPNPPLSHYLTTDVRPILDLLRTYFCPEGT